MSPERAESLPRTWSRLYLLAASVPPDEGGCDALVTLATGVFERLAP